MTTILVTTAVSVTAVIAVTPAVSVPAAVLVAAATLSTVVVFVIESSKYDFTILKTRRFGLTWFYLPVLGALLIVVLVFFLLNVAPPA